MKKEISMDTVQHVATYKDTLGFMQTKGKAAVDWLSSYGTWKVTDCIWIGIISDKEWEAW